MPNIFQQIKQTIGSVLLIVIVSPLYICNYFNNIYIENNYTITCKYCKYGACNCETLNPCKFKDVKGSSHYGIRAESEYNTANLRPVFPGF
jgi:hypothetical protein